MSAAPLLDDLIQRCTFPAPGTRVACAFSGGPDSTALVALARHAGLTVTAHHVDHQLRATSGEEADQAAKLADRVGAIFVRHTVTVTPGPNLEARAREARRSVLPADAMTGHTADDQAETLLLRLIRGSGATGLAAIEPGVQHPLLEIRRSETHALCEQLGLATVSDPSNHSVDIWRNRVRREVVPLLDDIAGRDVTAVLTRTAALLREDNTLLDKMAADLDPTDAPAIAAAPVALARRALRRWLTVDGYPPDAAAIDRVLRVADGSAQACELAGGGRVERSHQRLRFVSVDS